MSLNLTKLGNEIILPVKKIYLEQKPVEEKEYWYPMLIKL